MDAKCGVSITLIVFIMEKCKYVYRIILVWEKSFKQGDLLGTLSA